MTDAPPKRKDMSVIAAGLLILALALVVLYTNRGDFVSPIALVVIAAIGFAALLFQLRFRRDVPQPYSPLWLNILGVICAVIVVTAGTLRFSARLLAIATFAAVGCFGISGLVMLHSVRRQRRNSGR